MKKFLSILLLPCGLLLFSATGHAQDLRPGDVAPNWMLSNMAGKQVSLYQEAEQGYTTVMVFWASWCRYCRQLLPNLSELQENTRGAVRIYALNIWEDGDPLAYMREHQLKLELLPNADAVATRFDIRSTPGVVVVSPAKKVLYIRRPGTDAKAALARIKEVLPQLPQETQHSD